MEVEQVQELSEAEKNANYQVFITTIEFIQNGGKITEDWVEENKKLIRQWREWIPDFNVINPEVEDSTFRKTCQHAETLISYLCASGFDVKVYLMLLQTLKKLCDMLYADDELDSMMEMMSV